VTAQFHNRTRRSRSIPLSLLRRGRIWDIPVYYALLQSDLAREGLQHSGSHRFADHIYRGVPSGRGPFGRWLDRRFLAMPAARAFRFRYLAVRDELVEFLAARAAAGVATTAVLSVPCGIPRDLADAASTLSGGVADMHGIQFVGADLDETVLDEARRFMGGRGISGFRTVRGDALDRATYPGSFDFIACTGLTEFLSDGQAGQLFRVLFDVLRPGGCLVTSGMRRRWASDYLLKLGELTTQYRDAEALRGLLAPLPFSSLSMRADETGLQTVALARK
jgi:SAM-dependent methyltransferase